MGQTLRDSHVFVLVTLIASSPYVCIRNVSVRIRSTARQRLLMRLNVTPVKRGWRGRVCGIRSRRALKCNVDKRQDRRPLSVILRRKYLSNTWAKRINKLLAHRHLNCKAEVGAMQDRWCVTKVLIRIVRWYVRVNWVIVKYNIFTRMYDVHSKGVARSQCATGL